jgi:hypothetical protein
VDTRSNPNEEGEGRWVHWEAGRSADLRMGPTALI